ncbi:hypothetical protein B0G81_2349 [Paraburkholderia sp. BL6665CI2N2]|nr:hypothetical protein B0G81_2349 [Paraburkholderia sp. BL6665CI2N2]
MNPKRFRALSSYGEVQMYPSGDLTKAPPFHFKKMSAFKQKISEISFLKIVGKILPI